MPFQTYEEFNEKVMSRYQAQDYQRTFDLLDQEGSNFPEQAHQTHYLKACMAVRLERPDQAIALIEEAMQGAGWYGEELMRNSPSFAPLQGMPHFERLVELGKRRQQAAQGELNSLTLEPEGGCMGEQPCSLVLSLHGNAENGTISLNAWRSVVNRGRLLAALRSGQAIAGWQSVWTDVETSMQAVTEQYAKLMERYNIESSKTIIGGFSMGGEIALRTALQGTIPVQGFLLLAPSLPSMDELEGLLTIREQVDRRRLRGYVMLGGDDLTISSEDVGAAVKRLNEGGIPTHLGVLPGVAHRYPPNFDEVITRGIDFIEQQS